MEIELQAKIIKILNLYKTQNHCLAVETVPELVPELVPATGVSSSIISTSLPGSFTTSAMEWTVRR
jgi:hypothetical protein